MSVVKVVMLGDSAVGKTCLVKRAIEGVFDSGPAQPTIGGANLNLDITTDSGETVTLNIWDTAGQDRYRDLVPMYFHSAAVAIVVYDITKKSSFENLQRWIDLLKEKGPEDAQIVVVGNKLDLDVAEKRQVSFEEATLLSNANASLFYIEASAKTGQHVDDLFNRIANMSGVRRDEPLIIPVEESESKSMCCW